MRAEIVDLREGGEALAGSYRPKRFKKNSQRVQFETERGIVVNSLLTRDEWVLLDSAVVAAALPPLRAINDLRSRGLTHRLGSIASVASRWYAASEVTAANVTMSGRGGANRDLPELIENNTPIPVIFKEFEIDTRALLASRRMGDGLDVTALAAVTRVVAEGADSLLINGSGVRLNGAPLYGYRTHPNRNTATATALGGGAWSTITNIIPTIAGAINTLAGDDQYGNFMVYAATAQYNAATLNFFTDGSSETPRDRILRMPQVAGFEMLPTLAAGELLMVRMGSDVVDWAEPQDMGDIQLREWVSGDGLASTFKVMMVGAPRVKAHQDGKSGIMHVTGA